MIPYGRQEITEDDIAEIEKVLRSDYLTQGPVVNNFEKKVSEYCGAKFGIAVNSATSALHLSCLALNLGPGDWLWTSPNTFVASANCGLYCGSKIDFVDIDPKTYNISIDALRDKLKKAEKIGQLPKVLIPVHFAGQPCDMKAIHELSKIYGFKIIEDASHAIGASYKNTKIGDCKFSDITVFSFHPVKIITTGEGGMALTNNKVIAEKISRLRTHGITKDISLMNKRPLDEIWNYQQIELGYNYRMNDIQAALGINQLMRIDKYITARHLIANEYQSQLSGIPIILPYQLPNTNSSFHLYPVCINVSKTNQTQKDIYKAMHKNDIFVNIHYIPVHRHPYFEKLGFQKNDFPEAEKFYKNVLTLPIYPTLDEKKQQKVIDLLIKELN